MPKFSFIIPALNEEAYIKGCLLSIRNQTMKDYEVIVVFSGSDSTGNIAQRYAKVFVQPRKGPGNARNFGASKAGGDVLIFADADTRFLSNFLEKLERKFRLPISGGAFRLRLFDSDRFHEKAIFYVVNSACRIISSAGIGITNGSCFAYGRAAFEQAGGFPEQMMTNEDQLLAMKAGRLLPFRFFNDIPVYTSKRRMTQMGFSNSIAFHLKSFVRLVVRKDGLPLKSYWK